MVRTACVLIILAFAATSSAERVSRPAKPSPWTNIFEPKKLSTLTVIDMFDDCMKVLDKAPGTYVLKVKHCGCYADWLRSKPTLSDDSVYKASRACAAWSSLVEKEKRISRSPYYDPSLGFESERVVSAHIGCLKGGKKTDPTAPAKYTSAFCGCLGDAVHFRKGTVEKPFANLKPADQDACEAHARTLSGRK